MTVTPESRGVTSKRGEPPKAGTQKILASRDVGLATAFNQNVVAIVELQAIVMELLERVATLERSTDTRSE